MKYKEKSFNQQWFDERVEEIRLDELSETDRIVILAEAIVLYLEKKINSTVFLVIINLLIIFTPYPKSLEFKKIEGKFKKIKPYESISLDNFETKYSFTLLLEELIHLLKILVAKDSYIIKAKTKIKQEFSA